MNLVDDIPRLAKVLLQNNLIDQKGLDAITVRYAEKLKLEAKSAPKGAPRVLTRNADSQGGAAIRFIAVLRLKLTDRPGSMLTEDEISKAVARHFSLPYEKIDPMELNIDVITAILPKAFALKHMALPIRDAGGVVELAICDPEMKETLDGVTRVIGKRLEVVMTAPTDLAKIIHELYGFRASVKNAAERLNPSIDLGNLEQLSRVKKPEQIESNDEHITNAVDYLFNYAFEMRASDIHLEPKRAVTLVRFRIDGMLQKV